jgi:hypothetical protein
VISAALMAVAALYVFGLIRLWLRLGLGRAVSPMQAFMFMAGIAMLAMALSPWVHELAERFF